MRTGLSNENSSESPDFDNFHNSIFNKTTCQFLVVSFVHWNHHLNKYSSLMKFSWSWNCEKSCELRSDIEGGQIINWLVLIWTPIIRSHGLTVQINNWNTSVEPWPKNCAKSKDGPKRFNWKVERILTRRFLKMNGPENKIKWTNTWKSFEHSLVGQKMDGLFEPTRSEHFTNPYWHILNN